MDDDPSVREVIAGMLAYLGYETKEAPEGRTALALFKEAKEQGEPFAAVILDLMVPGGMGGQETVRLLQQLDPGVKAIVSSGYAKEPVVESFQDYGFVASLPKPYSLEQIGLVLQKVSGKVEVG
jgi:CheY-like chemotaxis protein